MDDPEPESSTADVEEVAELVTGALDRAGIAWDFGFKQAEEGHVHIEIDVGHDDDRGVYLDWELARRDREAARAAFEAKRYHDPAVTAQRDRYVAANARITQALLAEGITVTEYDEDRHPYVLKVTGTPKT